MRRNTALLAVGLAAMLLLAGCSTSLSPGSAAAAPGEDAQPDKSIAVGASGTAETSPDQAVVRVAAEATGDDASTVRERLAANASRLREALADVGVDDDQIRTRHYDIDRNRRHLRDREADDEPAYRGVHAFEVTLSNVSKTGEVVDAAVENGASDVGGVRFTLSEEARRDLRERALEDAMDNARSQAETLAARANLSVEGVHAIETNEHRGYHAPPRATPAVADAGSTSTSIDSGPVTISTQVRVTYNATDA